MKKSIKLLFSILVASFFITSCNNGNNSITPSNPVETPPEPSVETISLSKPLITLSYITEPVKNWVSCNEILEETSDSKTSWDCDFYTFEKIGYGTKVTITTSDTDVELYYTLDGKDPTTESTKYTAPFELQTICKIRVKAFNQEEKTVSEITELNVESPYGTTSLNIPYMGDGISGTYVICEALSDKSGPDFTKQHYFLQIDDNNINDGDGIPAKVIQSFDSYTERYVDTILGSNFSFDNDYYESEGSWTGTLWTKDVFEITELKQQDISAHILYDTIYLARYVYTAKYMENMVNQTSAELYYCIQTAPSGKCYAVQDVEKTFITFISEDITKAPSEADFYVTAYEGYFIDEDRKAVLLTDDKMQFTKINKKTNYWQWTSTEYSN